jgi:glycosyltransferase involved in cell wall biosynthesis
LLSVPDGEAREIVDGHQAGLWVPPENPEALADAVKNLCDDPNIKDQFAANALAAAPEHSRSVQAREMIEVFEKALQ